jgi:hypothetical protein
VLYSSGMCSPHQPRTFITSWFSLCGERLTQCGDHQCRENQAETPTLKLGWFLVIMDRCSHSSFSVVNTEKFSQCKGWGSDPICKKGLSRKHKSSVSWTMGYLWKRTSMYQTQTMSPHKTFKALPRFSWAKWETHPSVSGLLGSWEK